jgi:hypothetical protein
MPLVPGPDWQTMSLMELPGWRHDHCRVAVGDKGS